MSANYYEVLGVSRLASAAEMSAAYKKQALIHHPDRGGSTKKMQELAHVYAVLCDPKKRSAYDRLGREEAGTGDVFSSIVGLIPWFGGGAGVGVLTFCWRTAWLPATAAFGVFYVANSSATDARQRASIEPASVAGAAVAGFIAGFTATALLAFSAKLIGRTLTYLSGQTLTTT